MPCGGRPGSMFPDERADGQGQDHHGRHKDDEDRQGSQFEQSSAPCERLCRGRPSLGGPQPRPSSSEDQPPGRDPDRHECDHHEWDREDPEQMGRVDRATDKDHCEHGKSYSAQRRRLASSAAPLPDEYLQGERSRTDCREEDQPSHIGDQSTARAEVAVDGDNCPPLERQVGPMQALPAGRRCDSGALKEYCCRGGAQVSTAPYHVALVRVGPQGVTSCRGASLPPTSSSSS
jgi:hypothetical protein